MHNKKFNKKSLIYCCITYRLLKYLSWESWQILIENINEFFCHYYWCCCCFPYTDFSSQMFINIFPTFSSFCLHFILKHDCFELSSFASQIPPIRGIEWKYAEKWKYGNFLLTTDGSKLFGKILIKLIIMRFLCRFWSIPFGILITLCWELLWCSMFKLCKWVFLGIFGDFNWFRARVGWPAETAQSTRWHCVHSLLNWPAFAVWMRSRLETEIFCCCRTIYWNHMFRIYLLSKCKHHISYN